MQISTALSRYRICAALCFGLLFVSNRVEGEEPAAAAPPAPVQDKKTIPEFTLGDCIAVAVGRQPALRAVLASQDATIVGQQALNNIGPLGSLLSRDLPVRKQQASQGLVAASADVQKVHNDVVHDVTRLYYSVVYARQQEQFASDVVAQVEAFVDIARKLLNSGTPGEMTKAKLDLMLIQLAKVRKLHLKALSGVKKAEAALREAMGVVDGSLVFQVKDKELPIMDEKVPVTREQVIEMALCRRPELAMASAGAAAFRLEVAAQSRVRFRRQVSTLAAGSDLHARILPAGSRQPDGDYRPEPILPEMPAMVVGRRADRVARVAAYSNRADAVCEKARDLITLEAETTFIDFDASAKSLAISRESMTAAKDLMDRIRDGFDNPKAAKEQLLLSYGQAAEAQGEYVQAVFQYLLDMAALERVTGGGVRPAFPGR